MKKGILFISLISIFLFSFDSTQPRFKVVDKAFSPNEVLKYEVNYGLISAGEATIQISPETFNVNNRSCYKIVVNGRSTGAFDMIAKIDDVYSSYIDTAAVVPHISQRKLSEGGYRKFEVVKFDHNTSFLETKTYNYKKQEYREPKYHFFPPDVHDIISGFYYLRSLNFDTINTKDTISFNAFFEDKVYDFKILYLGKEVVKTEFGKVSALVLKPIMPDNKIFAGENSITCWLSDDKNKVPLRIKADLFIGSAEVKLAKHDNLKSPLKIIDSNMENN